jgi:large subunit ribosomal protein L32
VGAQPKQRISRGRRGKKQAHHALSDRQFERCSNCRSLTISHRVCPVCGHYRGEEIVVTDDAAVSKYR